jgi:cell filamentation protein
VVDFHIRRWEDYTIDGRGTGVLRNLRGITDGTELARFEQDAARFRLAELVEDPVQGDFDLQHMKEVHRRIFQDVYQWAGQIRVGPIAPVQMTKMGPDVSGGPNRPPGRERPYAYYPGSYVEDNIHKEFRKIADRRLLGELSFDTFVAELAERWAEINVIHAFREGNTRSQFIFFRQLAEHAGWRLESDLFQAGAPLRDEFVNARFYAHEHDSSWLEAVLAKAIEPLDPGPAHRFDPEPPAPSGKQPRLGDLGVPKNRGRFASRTRGEAQTRLRP